MKALYALQIADTTLYLIVGIVVYAYAGRDTVSPALGNTGTTLRRIAYGIALPTIMIAGVINGHVCAKLVCTADECILPFDAYKPVLRDSSGLCQTVSAS